jgi:glycosyltransferase involved in cell wall biosynthesis
LGNVAHESLPNVLSRAFIFVLTSTNESFGKVFLEAAMARLPLVSTATTGALEIISDAKTGFIVPIGNAMILAEKIIYLLHNQGVAKEMGEAAYHDIKQRFNAEASIQAVVALWEKLLHPSPLCGGVHETDL